MTHTRKKDREKADLIDLTLYQDYHLSILDRENGLVFLRDFFRRIRPDRMSVYFYSDKRIDEATRLLTEHSALLKNLKAALFSQLINTDLVPALTQSGLMQSQGFMQELSHRISYKVLPPYQDKNDFLYVLNHIFYKKSDYIWVGHVSRNSWIHFFETVGYKDTTENPKMLRQIMKSILILSYRVTDLGLSPDFTNFFPEEYKQHNPFLAQSIAAIELEGLLNQEGGYENAALQSRLADLETLLQACATCIKTAQDNQGLQGASVSLTYTTMIIESSLERLRVLVDAISQNHHLDTGQFVDLFRLLVRNEKRKSSVWELFSQNLGYVAYQIAEHKGHKGEKYITTTRKGWFRMVYTAAWGGFIICIMAFFKTLLHLLKVPPFWLGVAYSINYSFGFVAIEETGSTLATKQPAFTASAVAGSLDSKKNGKPNLYQLAVTVARVMRSQNASFIGNLIVVLPLSYIVAWLHDVFTGHKLVDGVHAFEMLEDQHPWHSLSLLYASNAGVFLFVTGLLAGYVSNKMKYEHVAARIVDHPILSVTMSKKRLEKIGHYIEHHSGALAGNIAFGFLMGMSSVVTLIFGIKFDVRHVTIASANVAYGIYGYGWSNLTPSYLFQIALGLFGIGFFNFAVSFFLAFYVAVRSRGIKMRDYPEFIKILWLYFRKHPLRFFFPGKGVKYKDEIVA
ncbi:MULTISPECIES: site-specific recombinase [Chitinophagaceae]